MKIIKAKKETNQEILDFARSFVDNTKDDWNYITPEELNKSDLSDFYILDIRKPEDYAKGHIEGANNIFWLDLLKDKNLKKLPKDKKILLVCYVGHTSSQVLVILKMLGYDVISLKFGMGKSPDEKVPISGWLDFGYKVTKE
jgi:rhodanese-related sulfurtransferase